MSFQKSRIIGKPGGGLKKVDYSGWIEFVFQKSSETPTTARLVGALPDGQTTPPPGQTGIIALPSEFTSTYNSSEYRVFVDYIERRERSRSWSTGSVNQRIRVRQQGYAPAGIPDENLVLKDNSVTELSNCGDNIENVCFAGKKMSGSWFIDANGATSNFGMFNSSDVTVKTICSQRSMCRILIQFLAPPATMPGFSFDDIVLGVDYVENSLNPSSYTLRKL